MNLLTILLCLALGIVMTFHASMNARIGTLTGNPLHEHGFLASGYLRCRHILSYQPFQNPAL